MSSVPGDGSVAQTEVTGEIVAAVAGGVEKFSADCRESARSALRERDIAAPEACEWYSLAACVGAIEAIGDVAGDQAVNALGQRIVRAVAYPDGLDSVPAALATLDEVYRERHRGDAGGYAFRQIGDEDGRVECHTPYPCSFDRGVVEGVAVAHADGFVRVCEVGACRADGADRCTYDVSW